MSSIWRGPSRPTASIKLRLFRRDGETVGAQDERENRRRVLRPLAGETSCGSPLDDRIQPLVDIDEIVLILERDADRTSERGRPVCTPGCSARSLPPPTRPFRRHRAAWRAAPGEDRRPQRPRHAPSPRPPSLRASSRLRLHVRHRGSRSNDRRSAGEGLRAVHASDWM